MYKTKHLTLTILYCPTDRQINSKRVREGAGYGTHARALCREFTRALRNRGGPPRAASPPAYRTPPHGSGIPSNPTNLQQTRAACRVV